MGFKKLIWVTLLASVAEWVIYLGFQGRYGVEVNPALISVTIPFMLFANFVSANIAQKIFTGRINWNGK